MTASATPAELRAAYDASTFGRTLSFEQALDTPLSRAALELGALILRAPHAAHVADIPPRPRPPLQRRLPL